MERRGPYKTQALRILEARGVTVGTVLDVGVCHGTPELMQAYRKQKHLLFEPVAEFAEKISQYYRNIDHELHQVAIGAESGTAQLAVSSVLPDMEVSHSQVGQANGTGTRSVKLATLDEMLTGRNLPLPYLLKIDVDGQELKVIAGARETLEKCSIVIVECQSAELAQRIGALQNLGFGLYDLAEPCYYDSVFWQCDAVFVRNNVLREMFRPLVGQVEKGLYEAFRQ